MSSLHDILDSSRDIYDVETSAPGPAGRLPLTEEMLRTRPSGDIFGLSQNAGMGWDPRGSAERFLILSTQGGVRARTARRSRSAITPATGRSGCSCEAARELTRLGAVPFAASCSDPCDGRTQGTTGMFDSLPYRNDAAIVLRRLIRSLPTRARRARRRDVRQGPARDDDGAGRDARPARACSCPAA